MKNAELVSFLDHYFEFFRSIEDTEDFFFAVKFIDYDWKETLSSFIWRCAVDAYHVWHHYHFSDDNHPNDVFVEMIL